MTDKKIDKNWRIEYKKPIELSDHKSNPRKITKERFELLKDRIKSQGFRVPPSVDNDYILLAGHQRIKALIDMGLGDEPIAISVPEFKLTEKERQEILSSDNLSWGEFDYDILANEFEMEDLIEWGFDKMDFGVFLEDIETDNIFTLPEGEKAPFQQITFTLADEQANYIKQKIEDIKKSKSFKYVETFGNENSNGNALYLGFIDGQS